MKQLGRLSAVIIFFLLSSRPAFSQTENPMALFTLKGKIVLDGKPAEGVSLELLKDGKQLVKTVTSKNGKYSFDMHQDTENKENEYTIYISKDLTVPKTLIVNTYIPKEEYDDNTFEYVLEISLLPTAVHDIVLKRPSAKIKWDTSTNNFNLDQQFAKIIQEDEEKLKRNPDKYLKELAERKKSEDDAKKAREEEAAKKIRDSIWNIAQKAADAAAIAIKQKQEDSLAAFAAKENLKQIEEDELAEQAKIKEAANQAGEKAIVKESKKSVKQPVITQETTPTEQSDILPETQIAGKKDKLPTTPSPKTTKENITDLVPEFALKKDKIDLQKYRERQDRNKNENLSTKYETNNMMSSLLDAVDAHEKKMKNK